MLTPPKKVLFAIEAVLDIAYNAGGQPVQSSEITKRQGIPRRYLEQTLQALVRHKVLVGVRGPKGGYRLARERRRISVGDIVRVINTPDTVSQDALPSSDIGIRVIQPLWSELHTDMMTRLDNTSIADLCQSASQNDVPCAAKDRLVYEI